MFRKCPNTILALSLLLCGVLPRLAQSEQFSIVVIPDTQFYSEVRPELFEAQMQWVADNQVAENIIYVAHLGDLKDDLNCDNQTVTAGTGGSRTEWQIVDDALEILEEAGIPYSVVPGNHDFNQVGGSCPDFDSERPLSLYNDPDIGGGLHQGFPPARFAARPHYGAPGTGVSGNRVGGTNEDNFTLFGFCGVKFIAINLAYKEEANMEGPNAELTWANNLLTAYPDRLGIITSHNFVREGGELASYGQQVYDALSANPNLLMMLNGHRFGEAWVVQDRSTAGLEPVHMLMQNYQQMNYPTGAVNFANLPLEPIVGFTGGEGDSGFMRIMRFDTDTGMVNIETFSPAIPSLGRPTDLVSTYSPGSGAGMDTNSASNLSFSFQGYGAAGSECTPIVQLVSCGTDTTGGDLIDRGFFHPSYPGSSLDQVELFISSRAAGDFTIRLDARLGSYVGPLIASNSQTRTLSGVDEPKVSYLFDMGDIAVVPGSTVAFTLTQESGPETEVFYSTDSTSHPLGIPDPTPSCDIDETTGISPPLDTFRRDGVWIRIQGRS